MEPPVVVFALKDRAARKGAVQPRERAEEQNRSSVEISRVRGKHQKSALTTKMAKGFIEDDATKDAGF
jgi:hypothetical protein